MNVDLGVWDRIKNGGSVVVMNEVAVGRDVKYV